MLKASLVENIVPLGELVKLLKAGKLPAVESAPKEAPQREEEKQQGEPKGEKTPQVQPPRVTERPTQPKVEEKRKASLTRQGFINKLLKDEILEKPFVSMLVKYIKETDGGLLVEIPETFYKSFKDEIEKLKKYYGKYAEFKLKEEVKQSEKKFSKLKNTRYLF